MIHLKVNFNSVFIFIYIFFNLHIFKSVLEKNDDDLHIKDERHEMTKRYHYWSYLN